MPATKTKPSSFQEQTLDAIRESQKAIVDSVHAWAESVEQLVPSAPRLPFADQVPSPQELVQTSFDFAEQLLRAQREFAETLLSAYAPLYEQKEDQSA